MDPRKYSNRPPPPPPPPPPSRSQPPPSREAQKAPQHQPPAGSFAVGVETEFLIKPLGKHSGAPDAAAFSKIVAAGYMEMLRKNTQETHPAMHNAINESFRGARYSEWSLDQDSTIAEPNPGSAPWGLEVISPILRVHPNSAWRTHITRLWEYLAKNFQVTANTSCGTHVHISVPGGYSLIDLQRVACSVIHFEPAFEALLPLDRCGNEYTKSNWIDNKNFGYKNKSRADCMYEIMGCGDLRSLILLMNPDHEGDHDKMFGWNFLNLLASSQSTIEFRRGAASTSELDVFMWIEVATSFLMASMKVGTYENLLKVPSNVGGLKWFINAAQLPGNIHDPSFSAPFFNRQADSAARQPAPVGQLSTEKTTKLKRKKLEDKQRNIMLSKTLQPPYWS